LQKEIASFVACVREGGRPQVSGEEGRNALDAATRVTEAVQAHLARLQQVHPAAQKQ
jgi:predicted dehydrogenase